MLVAAPATVDDVRTLLDAFDDQLRRFGELDGQPSLFARPDAAYVQLIETVRQEREERAKRPTRAEKALGRRPETERNVSS